MYRNPILCLIRFCKDADRQELDAATVEEFINYHAERCANGEISNNTLVYYRRPVKNFLNYIVTGMVHPVRKLTPEHSPLFEGVIDDIRTDDIFNTPDRAHMVISVTCTIASFQANAKSTSFSQL